MIRRLPASGRVALAVVALLWLVAAISPLFAERAAEIRLEDRLQAPSPAHPFGTDDLGRDLAARVASRPPSRWRSAWLPRRSRSSWASAIGGAAGYFGGVTDLLLSRLIEVVLCFPVLFLLLALAAFLPPLPPRPSSSRSG